jgi:hypothetical protein
VLILIELNGRKQGIAIFGLSGKLVSCGVRPTPPLFGLFQAGSGARQYETTGNGELYSE